MATKEISKKRTRTSNVKKEEVKEVVEIQEQVKEEPLPVEIPKILAKVPEPVIEEPALEVNSPKVIRWRKVGAGTLRLGNKIIKPNEVFTAREEDIPHNFRDVILPLDVAPTPIPVKKTGITPTIQAIPSNYKMVKRPDVDLYDIVDAQGKQLNEKPLSEHDANILLSVL